MTSSLFFLFFFFSFSIIKDFYHTWHTQKTYPTAINIANVRLKPTSCIRNNKIYCIFLRPWLALYFFPFFFLFFLVYSLAICVWNLYTFETKIRAAMRFKNINNEDRMERRKTEATGGNWPRMDILCKHVQNVYIWWRGTNCMKDWDLPRDGRITKDFWFRAPLPSLDLANRKKIGTFENL